MKNRGIQAAFYVVAAAAIAACSGGANLPQYAPAAAPLARPLKPSATQYLYVYNEGSPGVYSGQYARYSLPDLSLLETTVADGVGGPVAFGKGDAPYFVDEAAQGGYALYLQPGGKGAVPGREVFYGIPCQGSSLATGPTGNVYVVQYCSGNVLEYSSSKKTGKPKKPIATYTGGNLGQSGVFPISAVVDLKGDLYVGDNHGGVTYFKAASTTGVVALASGSAGYVNQMVVDAKGDVWTVHGSPPEVYFKDKTSCVPDPSGSIVRYEQGERFSKGTLAQHLYTSTSDSPVLGTNGISIAVDSARRVYTGNMNTSDDGVLVDFDPGSSCPNDALSFTLPTRAFPQVAVDAQRRFYVTDYNDNTISEYTGGSKKRLKKITQGTGIVAITYAAVNP